MSWSVSTLPSVAPVVGGCLALYVAARCRDPEGRMPAREHLLELRDRAVTAGGAVVLGGVAGWLLYPRAFDALVRPLSELGHEHPEQIVTLDLGAAANPVVLRLHVAVYLGLLLSSPVWLYQLWAFIAPGPPGRERRYTMSLAAAAVALLAGGVAVGWLVLPDVVTWLVVPSPGSSVVLPVEDYVTFVLRTVAAVGIAFVLPLLLVPPATARPAASAGSAPAPLA